MLLAGSFLAAALAKLGDRRAFAGTLVALGLPAASTWAVLALEVALAAALLAGGGRAAAGGALLALAAFSAALVRLGSVPCRCFGASSGGDARSGLVRNALLGAAAAVLVVWPAEAVWDAPADDLAVAFGLVTAVLAMIALRLQRRLDALLAILQADVPQTYDDVAGVALYDDVEPFAVAALDGTRLTIGGEGPPTLLVFHQPHCLECQAIPTALEALPTETRVISVLTAGREPSATVPTVLVDDLPPDLRVDATPAAIGIAREGLVCLLGRPATLEQLAEAAQATATAAVMAPGSQRTTAWGVCTPYWEVNPAGAAP